MKSKPNIFNDFFTDSSGFVISNIDNFVVTNKSSLLTIPSDIALFIPFPTPSSEP